MTSVSTVPLTVGELVGRITSALAAAGIADARAEARDLVAAVAGEGRFWPNARGDRPASMDLVTAAEAAATRRSSGMPFAYAVRRAAFRHLTLTVDERVLIPRQETEQLVDLVLARHGSGVAADVSLRNGQAYIDGARIATTDLAAGNGVIHVIDAVMLPFGD